MRTVPNLRTLAFLGLALAAAAAAGLLASRPGSAEQGGGYLEFNGPGAGYMEVPDDAGLNPDGQLTLEAWVWLQSYAAYGLQTECPAIIGKNLFSAYALGIACGDNASMDSTINGDNQPPPEVSTPAIPLEEWTHIAVTYDGTTRRHFINGQQVFETANAVGPVADTADPLRVGNDVLWDGTPQGRIDDVRIWNVARTQQSIDATKDNVANQFPGLVARWTFDEGSVTDLTGGREGVLVGDVTLIAPSPTPTPAPPGTAGDANCDGRFMGDDAALMMAKLAGAPFETPDCPSQAGPFAPDDANCDGIFDVRDPLALLVDISGADAPERCQPECLEPTPGPSVTGATPVDTPSPTICVTPTPSPTPEPTPTPTPTPTAGPPSAT